MKSIEMWKRRLKLARFSSIFGSLLLTAMGLFILILTLKFGNADTAIYYIYGIVFLALGVICLIVSQLSIKHYKRIIKKDEEELASLLNREE